MEYIASISYGKDSLAMLEVIRRNKMPLDRIIHAEVMATQDTHADLPPMVEFKGKADRIIKNMFGIDVEHIRASKSYEEVFYSTFKKGKRQGRMYGWPFLARPWCNSMLKVDPIKKAGKDAVHYIGIAADEPNRLHTLTSKKRSPLAEHDINESWCRAWCEDNGLLSPIYTTATRGGCWFCHNQSIGQLRSLRQNHPELWKLMMKWDEDSPTTFRTNGTTVHDFDRRFELEDRQLTFLFEGDLT